MKYLNQLLPAEALLVYEGKDCSVRRYLKAGFMHLLLRRVLDVQKDSRGAEINGQADRLVSAGPEFLTYRAAECEMPLLTLFDNSPYGQEGFWFSQVVKVAYQKAGTKNSYIQRICNSSSNPGWYKKKFLAAAVWRCVAYQRWLAGAAGHQKRDK